VFLADKGKSPAGGAKPKSELVDVDVSMGWSGKKVSRVPVASSTMLAANGKLLATGGGKSVRLHDAKLRTKVEADCEAAVVGLAVESEKALIVATEASVVRVRVGGKVPKEEFVSRGAVHLLGATGSRVYGFADGEIYRLHDDKAGARPTGAHSDHITRIDLLQGGRIVTASWDGRVLAWKPEGGIAETLADRGHRVDSIAVTPDGSAVYFTNEKSLLRVAVAVDSKSPPKTTYVVGGEDVEEDLAEAMPDIEATAATKGRVAWGADGSIHIADAGGREVAAVQAPHDVLVFDDAGNVYGGGENGTLACVAQDGTIRWSRVEHGIDVLNGQLHGNPHRNCAALHARGSLLASLASDNTVRVFDGPSGERKLRYFRDVGIFNGIAISPSEKLLAFTSGSTLEVVDIATVKTVCLLDAGTWPAGARGLGGLFSRPSLMAIAWIDGDTLLVGAETGALFRVALLR
jgi:WD40 repeat protein